jgi:hypothetical protein
LVRAEMTAPALSPGISATARATPFSIAFCTCRVQCLGGCQANNSASRGAPRNAAPLSFCKHRCIQNTQPSAVLTSNLASDNKIRHVDATEVPMLGSKAGTSEFRNSANPIT